MKKRSSNVLHLFVAVILVLVGAVGVYLLLTNIRLLPVAASAQAEPIDSLFRLEIAVIYFFSLPEAANRIYLTILARLPTERELQAFDQYAKSDVVQGQEALTDLIWALLNSVEFLYRH